MSASPNIYRYWQHPFLTDSPWNVWAELKRDCFYGGLPKRLKVMVAYLKVGPQVRTYSDYLRATREAEKEDTIELSQSPRASVTDGLSKPRATSFFSIEEIERQSAIHEKTCRVPHSTGGRRH